MKSVRRETKKIVWYRKRIHTDPALGTQKVQKERRIGCALTKKGGGERDRVRGAKKRITRKLPLPRDQKGGTCEKSAQRRPGTAIISHPYFRKHTKGVSPGRVGLRNALGVTYDKPGKEETLETGGRLLGQKTCQKRITGGSARSKTREGGGHKNVAQ